MLNKTSGSKIVLVFHRSEGIRFEGLICHRTSSLSTGLLRVADKDNVINHFSAFVAKFVMQEPDTDQAARAEIRLMCRSLGHSDEKYLGQLLFMSPEVVVAFS